MENSVSQELKMLRSFAISIVGRDPEGDYRPEFVRAVLMRAKKVPTRRFTDKETFLAELLKND